MKPILLFSVLIFAVSCDMVVDIDVPFEKKQLVVNSNFNPDSLWSATISLNKHILDESEHWHVTNATVVIYENDVVVDQLVHRSEGRYTSNNNVKPGAGKTYRIEVTAPNYDPVSGQSHAPNPAHMKGIEVVESGDDRGSTTTIKVTFQDNGNETNYYQIKAYTRYPSLRENFIVKYYDQPVDISIDDPAGESNVGDWSDGIFLNDILFNGKEKEATLKTHYRAESITVEVRTISADLYQYETTSALQNNINGDPLAQPINVYSNIKKGFGIFAGYSSTSGKNGGVLPDLEIASASATTVNPGDFVNITVENLRPSKNNDYLMVVMKGESHYVYQSAMRISANTIQTQISDAARTGKIAVIQNDAIAVSDFEIIVE